MSGLLLVRGLVLSSMPIGEYDRRVLLLTKERGKISAFARGARKANSPLMAASRTNAMGEFEIFEGRNSYNLQNAHISDFFEGLVNDYDSMVTAAYVAEIADYYGREGLDASLMCNLLYVTYKALEKGEVDKKLIRLVYELRVIDINGECTDFFKCGICGKEGADNFDKKDLRLLCDNDAQGHYTQKISPQALYTLQFIVTAPLTRLYSFNLKPELFKELERIVEAIRQRAIDKPMKSAQLL